MIGIWLLKYIFVFLQCESKTNSITVRHPRKILSTNHLTTRLTHNLKFVGDIHQPLHNEILDIGGNSVAVKFSGVITNLHHVWDTNMPEKLIGGYSIADAYQWGLALSTAITSGVYADQASSWLEGMDLSDPVTTTLAWSQEANAFVCTTVMPDGVSALENQELSEDYYESCVPLIQIQIARAGYRLARWLDLIAAAGMKTEL